MGIVDPWQEVDLDRVMYVCKCIYYSCFYHGSPFSAHIPLYRVIRATYEWVVEEDRANSGKPSLGVA